MHGCHPILSCEDARRFESAYFAENTEREWAAMCRAGIGVADAALRDFSEIGGFPAQGGRVLVLAGKGHNAGDALIAAQRVRERHPRAEIEVLFALGERRLRPLAARAWRLLSDEAAVVQAPGAMPYDLIIDGIFGFSFRPPLPSDVAGRLRQANEARAHMRIAVDLPSGLDAPDAFKADFTYATGIVKSPLLALGNAGRLRYIDLGFFDKQAPSTPDGVLTPAILGELARWRNPESDKRSFGHLFIVGGSRDFSGAVLMNTMAALRGGTGLVTAFVPESLAPGFAARVPEAMWVAWPETPRGGLALEGEHLLREKLPRASALLIGSGIGREPETLALARSIVSRLEIPCVIDADALQADIVAQGKAPRILTPHEGEYLRIQNALRAEMVIIRKSHRTQLMHEGKSAHVFAGGPVLARGGSGDLLAGLVAGLLAQTPQNPCITACQGTLWHGLAADALARAQGATAVTSTQLLDYLPEVLQMQR